MGLGVALVLVSEEGSCQAEEEAFVGPMIGDEIFAVTFGVYHFIINGFPLNVEPFFTTYICNAKQIKR